MDGKRIINLDETCVSPDKDGLGLSKRKHYGTRSAPIQQKLAEFTYHDRVTLMPVIFADGSAGSPTFVFKSKRQPYRIINKNGF